MVRQFAAESAEGFFLWIETSPGGWTRAEQFELLCRFAATLAEDLFTAGRLTGAAVNAEEPLVIRRVRALESFLDRLAVLELPREIQPAPAKTDMVTRTRRNVITFAPEGAHGVAAYIDGEKTATT